MNVSEVRIRLVQDGNAEKLCAFATITLDNEFVVRDMKVIDGNNGLFVAMPSRKVMERCRKCGSKNPVRASFCNDCGARVQVSSRFSDGDGRMKVHVDVAHPVTSACREQIHTSVITAYKEAVQRASGGDSQVQTPLEEQSQPEVVLPEEKEDVKKDAKADGWQIFS